MGNQPLPPKALVPKNRANGEKWMGNPLKPLLYLKSLVPLRPSVLIKFGTTTAASMWPPDFTGSA